MDVLDVLHPGDAKSVGTSSGGDGRQLFGFTGVGPSMVKAATSSPP